MTKLIIALMALMMGLSLSSTLNAQEKAGKGPAILPKHTGSLLLVRKYGDPRDKQWLECNVFEKLVMTSVRTKHQDKDKKTNAVYVLTERYVEIATIHPKASQKERDRTAYPKMADWINEAKSAKIEDARYKQEHRPNEIDNFYTSFPAKEYLLQSKVLSRRTREGDEAEHLRNVLTRECGSVSFDRMNEPELDKRKERE